MKNTAEFNQQDYDLIEQAYAGLKESARRRCPNAEEFQVIQKAFTFANEAHKNVRRRSGEPYILHPIAVAGIVVNDIGLGYKSIAAALLHDVVEDTAYTVEDIRNLFGSKISSLVDGLTKIKTVLDNEDKKASPSLQAENFKRILLTLGDDARVVLIKLADRLHNCRTIDSMPEHKRDKILSETMYIFIPLAHRLGLYSIKSEMENIWLKFKEPEAYADISARIKSNIDARSQAIDDFIAPIRESLAEDGYDFEIKRRIKTPYSVWRKMQTKEVQFDQIFDLYAVRIIFDPKSDDPLRERKACYDIYTTVTSLYRYQQERTRDWIKQPKSNGYEALHCTLMCNAGFWIECQIRSRRMDDIAEKGIAAHWAYKRGGNATENENEMDRWLLKVKDIINSPDVGALELLDIIHKDLITKDIVVFTPKGEQRSIPYGSTVLDFAYSIHSQVGSRAIASKVNLRLAPLSQVLKAGDQVEIITADSGRPQLAWLNFLQTRYAKRQVLEYLKDHEPDEVGKAERILGERQDVPGEHEHDRVIINEHGKFIISNCCNPIPGDPVVGFKMADGSIVVHKKSCPMAENLASKYGNQMVVPQWISSREKDFPVRISIKGLDRLGLLNEITSEISQRMYINMRKLAVECNEGVFTANIEMFVNDRSDLDKMFEGIKEIDGVKTVVRTELE